MASELAQRIIAALPIAKRRSIIRKEVEGVISPHFRAYIVAALEDTIEGDEYIEVGPTYKDGWPADLPAYAAAGLELLPQVKLGFQRFALREPGSMVRAPRKL